MNTTTSILNDSFQQTSFTVLDYTLFCAMLGISALIGVYFGCYRHQDTVDSYVFGGKKMQVFPIAMSLIASNTSGIELLAVPADIYKFGATYIWLCLGIILCSLVTYYVYLPVFIKLKVSSTYEYLNKRFDKRIHLFASFLFVLSVLLTNPITIYIPALAFAQATGLNVHLITPVVCLICIFYTTIGGLKAVVWTDTLQGIAIVISFIIVTIMGILSAGGISAIYEKAHHGQRLDIFNFDIDPTIRNTFWSLTIGTVFNWTALLAINPATIQRLLAVSSMERIKRTIIIFCIGVVAVKLFCTFTGIIVFAKYEKCDPFDSKQINRPDQLVSYYVMDVAGSIPGLPGIFIAGVFSAGLSSLSTTVNTLSFTIYEDFISPFISKDITEKRKNNIMKLTAIIIGVISTLLVFVVEHLGGLLPLAVCFAGLTNGPLLGLFTLGMLFPMANAKGALWGGIIGFGFSAFFIFWNQWYKSQGLLNTYSLPVSTEECNFFVNATPTITPTNTTYYEPFVLFRITFWYFVLLGSMVVVIVGLIVSWLTKKNQPRVHSDMISPIVYCLYSRNEKPLEQVAYSSVKVTMAVTSPGCAET